MNKAFKLEIKSMLERKFSLLFYLIVPCIITAVLYFSTRGIVDWGEFASLNLKMYDLQAPRIFPIIILFVAIQLAVLRIVGERAPYGTLDRELVAISRTGMYFGKLLANLVFVFMQVILMYITGFILFPARNYGSSAVIFILLSLIALFGLVFGLMISIFSKNREQAIQLVPFVILILITLSGIFTFDNAQSVKSIADNMPLTLSINGLKNIMLDGVGFEDVIGNMIGLLIWIISLMSIGLIKFNLEQ